MKTKLFIHKLLTAGAIAVLGLVFATGAQAAPEAYAISIQKLSNFTTTFDPPTASPQPGSGVGTLESVTECSTTPPLPSIDGDNKIVGFPPPPTPLDPNEAECGVVRGPNNFNPVGAVGDYGSGDAQIANVNIFTSGEAANIGESFTQTPDLKGYSGGGRNTLTTDFTLNGDAKINFQFNADYIIYAALQESGPGSAANASLKFLLTIKDLSNPPAQPVVSTYQPAALNQVASTAVPGMSGSLVPSIVALSFTAQTPGGDPLPAGNYRLEITTEEGSSVTLSEAPMIVGEHFLCYKSFGHFLREDVDLFDQFEDKNFRVLKPKMFCNPAIKPVLDPNDVLGTDPHYLSYKIKEGHRVPHHERQMAEVLNQFGTIIVETFRPDRLMVPSGKSLNLALPPVIPASGPNTNHYKCYTVRATGFQSPGDVAVLDQFTDPDSKKLGIVRPTRLCNPVEKTHNGVITPIIDDPNNEFDHLMCYSVKAGAGEKLHKKTKVLSNNQFREEELVLKRELEFCVPSKKTVLIPQP